MGPDVEVNRKDLQMEDNVSIKYINIRKHTTTGLP